ncbi:kynureninase [Sphingomonas gilva]|uniref:Kynureninase n=1 Tax=Sphingomonas gilva TaxID=2305907 RepID=A0A396RNI1_9SPHN|nr:kynureninase [Sphingomonas gilva]RHW17919.1 kynureninase [Sphingomonas gilva]
MTLEEACAADAADPLRACRDRFALPEGVIYLDGNSLGALPAATPARQADLVERQWRDRLIRGWNEGWIEAPRRVGAKIAPLIGAAPHEVIAADSTSANLFKLIVAVLQAGERRTVLSEAGNFPTDLHVAEGAVRCVPGARLEIVTRESIAASIGADTALVVLTHVHYKTAQRYDMKSITAAALAAGAMILWDLSHSAGAVAVDLNSADADLAVGCGYKYLNGGPGAPAWLFVAERHQDRLANPLSGWMGHAQPFAFTDAYEPAPGIDRWLCGTPPVLALSALEAGLATFDGVSMPALEAKGARLFDLFAARAAAPGLECVTPADPAARGSHISFRHPHAWPINNALIEAGVIGDFRAPDILRFGLTPLYTGYEDVWRATEILGEVLATERWRESRFAERSRVT